MRRLVIDSGRRSGWFCQVIKKTIVTIQAFFLCLYTIQVKWTICNVDVDDGDDYNSDKTIMTSRIELRRRWRTVVIGEIGAVDGGVVVVADGVAGFDLSSSSLSFAAFPIYHNGRHIFFLLKMFPRWREQTGLVCANFVLALGFLCLFVCVIGRRQ